MNKQIKAGADIHAGDGGYSEGIQEQYDAFVKVRNKSLAQGRIRELAEQAGMVRILDEHAHEYGNGMFENTPYPELEKFTELIVRECTRSIENTIETDCITDGEKMGCEFAILDMLKHFGVEE